MAINSTDPTVEQLYKQKLLYDASKYSQAYGGYAYNPVESLTHYGASAGQGLTNPEVWEKISKRGIMGFFAEEDIDNINNYLNENKYQIATDILTTYLPLGAIFKGLSWAKKFRADALKPIATAVENSVPLKSILENPKMLTNAGTIYEKELATMRASKNFLPESLLEKKLGENVFKKNFTALKNMQDFEKEDALKIIKAIDSQYKLKKKTFPNWTHKDQFQHMHANFKQNAKAYEQIKDIPNLSPEEIEKVKKESQKYQYYLDILEKLMKDID